MTEITLPNINEQDAPSIEIKSHLLHKVTRKGDKIYYTEPENVTNIENSFSGDRKISQDSENPNQSEVENVESGESLYKTFSFEANKEETQKCIAFWRSVVEKNLQPMKCTIIESLKEQQAKMKRSDSPEENKNSKKSKESKGKLKIKAKQKAETKNIKSEDTSKWVAILKDLQKKRLNEIRLIAKKRCSFCEAPSADLDDQIKDKANELKRELKELDKFEPKYNAYTEESAANELASRFVKTKSKAAKKISLQGKQKLSLELKDQNDPGNVTQTQEKDELHQQNEKPKITDLKLASIKIESEQFKLVDVISNKEKSGAYSKWRKNKIEGVCKCTSELCSCNQNPAIVSIKQNINPDRQFFEEDINAEHETNIKTTESKNIELDFGTISGERKTSVTFKHEIQTKYAEADTTSEEIHEAAKDLSDLATEFPKNEEMFKLSRDLHRELFDESPGSSASTSERSERSTREYSVIEEMYINPNQGPKMSQYYKEEYIPFKRNPHKESILVRHEPKLGEPEDELNPVAPKESMTKIQRSLSIMIDCTCGEEECDCKGKIELISDRNKLNKEKLSKADITLPQPSDETRRKSSGSTLGRRDSFEVIYRKMSVSGHNLGKFRLSTVSADSQGNVQYHHQSDDTPKGSLQ